MFIDISELSHSGLPESHINFPSNFSENSVSKKNAYPL